jgi:hypothetical protein
VETKTKRPEENEMTEKTYFTCAETAKMIRQALKEAFPDVKFSVRVIYLGNDGYSEVGALNAAALQ